MDMPGSWQRTDNPFFEAIRQEDNYLIVEGDNPNSNYIAVYCSSNGIYFPNDDETFIKRIITQNKYDWKSNHFVGVKKHIYIRDIYKQWYVNGINTQVNNINSLIEFLNAQRDEGDTFVFLGSSAGGYLAVALSTALGGIVFAGSPQINLPLDDSRNWLLKEGSKDFEKNQWFDLTEKVRNATSQIFILYGAKNRSDCEQLKNISNFEHIFMLPFSTDLHGVVFLSFNVPYFLSNKEKLMKISQSGKMNNKILFSFQICGFFNTIFGIWRLWLRRRKRK